MVDLLEKARTCQDPGLRVKLLRLWRQKAAEAAPSEAGTLQEPEEEQRAEQRLRQAKALVLRRRLTACSACELSRSRTRVVPWAGPVPAAVALVGEAPGYWEDQAGEPFVGKAGKLLDRLLLEAGLRREAVFITNAVLCRPLQNAQPKPEQVQACRHHLRAQLELSGARVVVALGHTAAEALGIGGPISWVEGQARWLDGRLVLPTFHPAAALRDPAKEEPIRRALLRARELSQRLADLTADDLDPRSADLPEDSRYWQELLACALLLAPDDAYPYLWWVRRFGGRCWPWVDGLGIDLPQGIGAEQAARRYAEGLRRLPVLRGAWVRRYAGGGRPDGHPDATGADLGTAGLAGV